ncbi:hypothetical protein F183_A10320 [Bryobacterales bacterium F-183]|nr:hypothetical protein F183_A10320 [Bryobacterales bacterium F-183]
MLEGFGVLHRIPVDVPRSDAQPDPSVALVNMQTNTMADHRWRISGTVHTPTTPDAVLFVADGQVWAAAFPHPAEKAEGAYTFSATLPSAIRQVRVYTFRQGAPWTFAAAAKP